MAQDANLAAQSGRRGKQDHYIHRQIAEMDVSALYNMRDERNVDMKTIAVRIFGSHLGVVRFICKLHMVAS